MKELLLVAMGGAFGACTRYSLSLYLARFTQVDKFPLSTFIVNVLGCLLAGLLIGISEKYNIVSPQARLFLLTGILGGFTTFSAFGVETIGLMRRGEAVLALSYVGLSVLCGLLALGLGLWLAVGTLNLKK
jgi:fluoride exporter